MPLLSIVIVSYNVSYFLQLTLKSVAEAIKGIEAEVFVVDNASEDDSVEVVKSQFPWVQLIEAGGNLGFAKANNIALRRAKGKYQLLLNPDVILAEDTLHKCLQTLEADASIGGLGVRMVDGSGLYLPESKRGLPTPWVSFCKIIGLASLFPTSPQWAKYYLGHLDPHQNHKVEVLSGAFMLMPAEVLGKIGLLDEAFFMYGEDVDLSYRITLAGYTNYYLADTTIVHFKGESTKKGSLKYVKVFYQAMAIFARKHFGNGSAMFDLAIQAGIVLRGFVSALVRVWLAVRNPLLDAILIMIGMYFLKEYWQENHKRVPGAYPPAFMLYTVPAYILAWLGSSWIFGGYGKPMKVAAHIRGVLVGMVIISAVTNFFDDWRYSKALILLGTGWAITSTVGWRLVLSLVQNGVIRLEANRSKRVVIVAEPSEFDRILGLIHNAQVEANIIGRLGTGTGALADLSTLPTLIKTFNLDEVVFACKDLGFGTVIEQLEQLGTRSVKAKVVAPDSQFIIGSSDKNNPGDFYTSTANYVLASKTSQRQKRNLEVVLATLLILGFPLLALIKWRSPKSILIIALDVLGGRPLIGVTAKTTLARLIGQKKEPIRLIGQELTNSLAQAELQRVYVQEYSLLQDLVAFWKYF